VEKYLKKEKEVNKKLREGVSEVQMEKEKRKEKKDVQKN
jgi:hypothetical protein